MERIDFSNIKITGGFWKQKQDLVRDVTVHAVYNRFKDTGRFDAFKADTSRFQPHIFWDSDVAKWMEGVAYLVSEKREPQLEAIVDELVDGFESSYPAGAGAYEIALSASDVTYTSKYNFNTAS